MLKYPTSIKEIFLGKIKRPFPRQVYSASLIYVFAGNCQSANQELLESDGDAQKVRNSRGARLALCAHPQKVKGDQ
jgi:hypothetical protein